MKKGAVKLVVLILWPIAAFAATPWAWSRIMDYGVSETVLVVSAIVSFVILLLAIASLFYAVSTIIDKSK